MEIIKLKEFQKSAILDLLKATSEGKKEILLKAPTGSGKTIILVNFIDQYIENIDNNVVFIWFTPGTGDLEEQSKKKMDMYLPKRNTKLIKDVIQQGFEKEDTCFINWEEVNKKDNTAIREVEKTNLYKRIEEARNSGIKFIIIVDEQHYNKTIKTENLKNKFNPEFFIGASATIKKNENSSIVEIKEEDVISEGLITKMVSINEKVTSEEKIDTPTNYLIDKSLKKQMEIYNEFKKIKKDIIPLILIQIPNKQEELYKDILKYLYKKLPKEEVAIWLDKKNENTENIEDDYNRVRVLIMKQAVAIGWDCPRAKILVKLRENMSEIFTIQTIGRIRRSIGATHYKNDILNTSFLYTYDSDFVNNVTEIFADSTNRKKLLYLKKEYSEISLIKESKKNIYFTRINKEDLKVFYKYFSEKYSLNSDMEKNEIKLSANGFDFSKDVLFKTKKGFAVSSEDIASNLEDVYVRINVKERSLERELNLIVFEIGAKAGIIDRDRLKTVLRSIFSKKLFNKYSILKLSRMEFTAFIINNKQRLKEDVYEAIKSKSRQIEINEKYVNKETFNFPLQKVIRIISKEEYKKRFKKDVYYMKKNVYELYPSNEKLSLPERLFLEYAEDNNNIEWIYKNGESSSEYFSILYLDNANKFNTFYPDFILRTKYGEIWIIETKGGENEDGTSRNIDEVLTPTKYQYLRKFCNNNHYRFGFVREQHIEGEKPILKILFSEKYIENMDNENWINIDNVF